MFNKCFWILACTSGIIKRIGISPLRQDLPTRYASSSQRLNLHFPGRRWRDPQWRGPGLYNPNSALSSAQLRVRAADIPATRSWHSAHPVAMTATCLTSPWDLRLLGEGPAFTHLWLPAWSSISPMEAKDRHQLSSASSEGRAGPEPPGALGSQWVLNCLVHERRELTSASQDCGKACRKMWSEESVTSFHLSFIPRRTFPHIFKSLKPRSMPAVHWTCVPPTFVCWNLTPKAMG